MTARRKPDPRVERWARRLFLIDWPNGKWVDPMGNHAIREGHRKTARRIVRAIDRARREERKACATEGALEAGRCVEHRISPGMTEQRVERAILSPAKGGKRVKRERGTR